MTIVVEDDVKKDTGVQNPGVNPQRRDMEKKLLVIADLVSITGTLFFLTSGIIRLFLDTSFRT